MKSQKCNIKIMFALLLLCSFVILGGCGTKSNLNVSSHIAEPSETIAVTETETEATVTPADTPTIAPTVTPAITPSILADGTAIVDVNKDIDGNEVNDSIQIISLKDGSETCMHVYLNGEQIFEYEDSFFRMYGVDAFESLDLDGDNTNEIFITASTNANCRPYEEVLCLKQTDGKWERMDYPKNDSGDNEFPFKITRGKNEFDFIISSDDTNQVIYYDASSFFVDDGSDNIDTIIAYRENHYKEGDEVGFISVV